MKANQAFYKVATMCRVLEVSTSGYYAWLKRPLSARAQADVALTERIVKIHKCSDGTYGVPRIYEELVAGGERIGRKRVARLMRAAGLEGVSRRKRHRTTYRDRDGRVAAGLVNRDFTAIASSRDLLIGWFVISWNSSLSSTACAPYFLLYSRYVLLNFSIVFFALLARKSLSLSAIEYLSWAKVVLAASLKFGLPQKYMVISATSTVAAEAWV